MLLSIVMPIFNELEYTKATIESIESKTNVSYELIIINDGSSDGTKKWLEKNKKPNRKVVHQENKGVTASRNLGVSMAQGEYIVVINNDVLIRNNTFYNMIASLEKSGAMMCCPVYSTGDRKGGMKLKYLENHIAGFFYMFRQSDRAKLFPLDERMKIRGSDNWLYFKMIYLGGKMVISRDAIVHHFKSMTVNKLEPDSKDRAMLFQICKDEGRYVAPCREIEGIIKEDLLFGF